MKKDEIKIGSIYIAKVSGRISRVRIDSVSLYGGWEAINIETGRAIRIKSALKLRREWLTKEQRENLSKVACDSVVGILKHEVYT